MKLLQITDVSSHNVYSKRMMRVFQSWCMDMFWPAEKRRLTKEKMVRPTSMGVE
jgi:hypothetical protein